MKKTILSLVMMLMMAFAATAGPTNTAHSANKPHVAFKGDSIIVSDGDEVVTVSGIPQKVRDKINDALDDTLTAGEGTTVEIEGHKADISPEDLKEMSAQWAEVAKQVSYASIAGLLALVLLVLLFRFLNRRNKYRAIEKAIENHYPLNDLSLTDVKRSAIYVQQPVVAAAPSQPGQVPVGTPLPGATADHPIVMTNMINWRALMPAIRVLGWGLFLLLFGIFVCGNNGNDPFTIIGLALMFVGACKGFILYKEQQEQMPPREPMREGIPVPPPFDDDYKAEDDNDSTPYQPY